MLGKLIKHEINATARLMLTIHSALIIVTLISKIALQLEIAHSGYSLFLFLGIFAYISAILFVMAAKTIYIAVRFYKNMYTKEGYLTFTLPAHEYDHLNCKILTATFWNILSLLIIALSVVVLLAGAIDMTIIKEFLAQFEANLLDLGETASSYYPKLLFSALISCFYTPILIYTCISVGQSFGKHKIMSSILFYFLYQIIISLFNMTTPVVKNLIGTYNSWTNSIYASSLTNQIITTALISIPLYFLCLFFMKKKLNLE